MLTAAVFVDAGNVFAAGGALIMGRTVPRDQVDLVSPAAFISRLVDQAGRQFNEPLRLLRTYWYDGARDGVASTEQLAIGGLSRVKLRLGLSTRSGQKGVDGLIILDLVTLALARSIDVAVLVSGDEDLREAARHAQQQGVSLVLMGMPAVAGQNQSSRLVAEADVSIALSPDDVSEHFAARNASAEGDAEPLRALVLQLTQDPRSSLDQFGTSLSQLTDKALVSGLARATNTFPVDATLLRQVRRDLVSELMSKHDRSEA